MMNISPERDDKTVVDAHAEVDVALDDEVHDLKGVAELGDPIVGTEVVTLDARGPGALAATPLPSPKEPTPAARERHNLTHVPYEDWCPFCVACRRPNAHHRRRCRDDRLQPLLVGDYAFVRSTGDDHLVPVLILRLKPFGIYLAIVVPNKGVHDWVVQRVSRFILDSGLLQFSYRADKEPSIVALFQEACRASGREGTNVTPSGLKANGDFEGTYTFDFSSSDVPSAENSPRDWRGDPVEDNAKPDPAVIGVPEHSHPGESQSNGAAEAAVKTVVAHARTLKAALESRLRLSKPLSCQHAVVH